jgi:hypothetical protein
MYNYRPFIIFHISKGKAAMSSQHCKKLRKNAFRSVAAGTITPRLSYPCDEFSLPRWQL